MSCVSTHDIYMHAQAQMHAHAHTDARASANYTHATGPGTEREPRAGKTGEELSEKASERERGCGVWGEVPLFTARTAAPRPEAPERTGPRDSFGASTPLENVCGRLIRRTGGAPRPGVFPGRGGRAMGRRGLPAVSGRHYRAGITRPARPGTGGLYRAGSSGRSDPDARALETTLSGWRQGLATRASGNPALRGRLYWARPSAG